MSDSPLTNIVLLVSAADAVSVGPGLSRPYSIGRFSGFAPQTNPAFTAARKAGSGDTMKKFGISAIGIEVPRTPSLTSMTIEYKSARADGAGPAGLYWTGYVGSAAGTSDFGAADPTRDAQRVAAGWELVATLDTPTDSGSVALSASVVASIVAKVNATAATETGPIYAFFVLTLQQLPGTRVYGSHPDWHLTVVKSIRSNG